MQCERWQQLEELCQEALEREESDRSNFLKAACGDDESLRREAESLLAYEKDTDGFMESSPLEFVARKLTSEDISLDAAADAGDDPLIGQIFPHYRILAKLGAGGMGVVYKAKDTRLRRFVALKFLSDVASSSGTPAAADDLARREALARMEREARACSALDHPNICTVYEIDQHNGVPFIAMQFLAGRTLKQEIGGTPLAIECLLNWALQIADGLAAAHSVGLVHRDINSANIFIGPRGEAKILDFGLAKLVPETHASLASVPFMPANDAASEHLLVEHTFSAPAFGTTAYMSPEQVLRQPLDVRSDLFSFGVVLYEMATGVLPFRGEAPEEIFDDILHREPTAPSALNREIPADLERIIRKALTKDRTQRYQSAAQIGADLQGLRHSLEGAAETAREDRRSKFLLAAVVAAGLVLATAISVYFYSRQHQPSRLSEDDTVLLTDFTNSTGEAIFDDTLKPALRTQLERSPLLNIVPDREASQTLGYLGRPSGTALKGDVARDVCLRLGSKAMVAGSIARLGADYLVDLKAADCQSGNPLDEEQKKAADRDGVLKALNAASRDMRAMLGESLATIQKYDPPAEQATTSSIEALRSYSLGVKMRATGGSQMSIPFFKRAVELDPNFAMAYARLGTAYYSVDQIDDADKATRQAFALRDHVSEREKLYIESHYYVTTTGQLDKAIESLKEWAQAYPRDPLAHADLGIVYAILGRHEDNLKEQLEAIRLASSNSTYYVPLATAYANLDRFKEAKFTMQQADARKLDDPFFVDVKYQLAFVFGEFDDANRRAAAESLARSSNTLLPYESDVATYYGHLVEARDLMKIAEQNAQRDNEGESVRAYQAIQALHEAELANPGEAKKLAETALVNEPAKQVQILAALALARAGDVNHATAIAHDLQRRYPVDTVLNAYWMPCILASIEIKQNSPAKALALLQAAAPYELGIPQAPTNLAPYPIFLRGEAYLTLKDGAAAAAEFQIIMNHRGVTSTSPLGSLAVLGLARAYALQSGRLGVSSSTALRSVSHSGSTNLEMTEKARSEYREFLALWAHADKNLPTLKEAQAEYRLMQQ